MLTGYHWCAQILAEAEQQAKALVDTLEAANKPLQRRVDKLEKSAKAKVCGHYFSMFLLLIACNVGPSLLVGHAAACWSVMLSALSHILLLIPFCKVGLTVCGESTLHCALCNSCVPNM